MGYNSSALIKKVYEQEGLLDILVSFEEYLDNMNLYVYEGWMDGVVVEGPIVSKYWVEVTLKYDGDKMPDPRGLLMFTNQGVKVSCKQTYEEVAIEKPRSMDDMYYPSAGAVKPQVQQVPVILFKFVVPRQLLDFGSFDEYKIIDAQQNDAAELSNVSADAQADEAVPEDNMDDMMSLDGEQNV